MRVLALDTSTRAGSVAIVENDHLLIERVGDASRSHAERLPNDLTAALAACALRVADVDVFAVAAGPGSFTGLRIGIATIQGLAFATHRRVVPVSVLLALAEAASRALPAGAVVGAWLDAHRRDVFSALYQVTDAPLFAKGRLAELTAPAVGDPEQTWQQWRDAGHVPAVLAGDGARLFSSVAGSDTAIVDPGALGGVMARLALARALAGESVDPAGIQPLYVRRPDAEVARERMA